MLANGQITIYYKYSYLFFIDTSVGQRFIQWIKKIYPMNGFIRPYDTKIILSSFLFCGFQFMMLNRRQTPAYDSRYKGWRGPRLESMTIDETGADTESMVISPNHFSFKPSDVARADF